MKKSMRIFLPVFLYSWVIMFVISLIWGDGTVLEMMMYCQVMAALAGLVWAYLLSDQRRPVRVVSCRRCGYRGETAGNCCPRCKSGIVRDIR